MKAIYYKLLLKFQILIGYRKEFQLKSGKVYLTKKEIGEILINEKTRREATKHINTLPKRKKKFGW